MGRMGWLLSQNTLEMTTVGSFHAATLALEQGCTKLHLRNLHSVEPDDTFRTALFKFGSQLVELTIPFNHEYVVGDWCANLVYLDMEVYGWYNVVEFLGHCKKLEHLILDIQHDDVDSVGEWVAKSCKNLHTLRIRGAGGRLPSFRMPTWPNLQVFEYHAPINDDKTDIITEMLDRYPKLTELRLGRFFNNDRRPLGDLFARFSLLTTLHIGHIDNYKIFNRYLRTFQNLEVLRCEHFHEDIYKLTKLHTLELLNVYNCTLDYSRLPNLKRTSVYGGTVNIDLSKMNSNMTHVTLHYCKCTGMFSCPNMVELRIKQALRFHENTAGTFASALSEMQQLEVLVLSEYEMDQRIAKLVATNLPKSLRTFDLDGSWMDFNATKLIVGALSNIKNIESLSMYKAWVDRKTCKALARGFANWPNLQRLNLGRCVIEDDGCLELAKGLHHCVQLESFNVVDNPGITKVGMAAMVLAMSKFTKLHEIHTDKNIPCATFAEAFPVPNSQTCITVPELQHDSDQDILGMVQKLSSRGHLAPFNFDIKPRQPATIAEIGKILPFIHPEARIYCEGLHPWVRRSHVYKRLFAFVAAEYAEQSLEAKRFLQRDGDRAIMHVIISFLLPLS